jgi:hypothetical protein
MPYRQSSKEDEVVEKLTMTEKERAHRRVVRGGVFVACVFLAAIALPMYHCSRSLDDYKRGEVQGMQWGIEHCGEVKK